jgi:hypothetical protein
MSRGDKLPVFGEDGLTPMPISVGSLRSKPGC